MSSFETLKDRRAALIIAHPGHELRVYRWLSLARPRVLIFTDGSGRSGRPRINRTTSIVNRLNGQPGRIYGRFTDAEIYSAILNGKVNLFFELVNETAGELVRNNIEYVVGDAFEGYNPAHDVCRLLIDTALELVRAAGRPIENFDVLLTDNASQRFSRQSSDVIWIDVDGPILAAKVQAARAYSELAEDVKRILEKEGVDSLRSECLRRLGDESSNGHLAEPPYYELYGETQVAAGYYKSVIRYRDHVLPLAAALRQFVESKYQTADCGS